MSKTTVITVPGVDFSARGRKFVADPILPSLGGALLLVDENHPANPTTLHPGKAGVPAHADRAYNIAWDQAKAMIGSGDATTLSPVFAVSTAGGGYSDPTIARIERTSKGGLHFFSKKAADTGQVGIDLRSSVGDPIQQFLQANSGADSTNVKHKFYVSQWYRVSRPRVSTIDGAAVPNSRSVGSQISTTVSPPAGNLLWYNDLDTNGASGITAGQTEGPASQPAAGQPGFTSFGSRGYIQGTGTLTEARWFQLGPISLYSYLASMRRGYADLIFYRTYVEDLTVSGRTYAQVNALDKALYTKDVLTAGGRFYGDTYTDPASVFVASA